MDSIFFQFLITFLIFVTLHPQQSTQEEISAESNVIDAHCMFNYDPEGRYNCYLFGVFVRNQNDVLNIVGTHMINHTDTDVHGVIFRSSSIIQFNGEPLRRFSNLRLLSLISLGIQTINPTAFDICGQLEELIITNNPNIVRLESRLLANCRNLRILTAARCRIADVAEDLFGNVTSLESIHLGDNRLTLIPDNLLRNIPNLRRFLISSNQLSSINPSNFFNAANLEEISIAGNSFSDPQRVMNLLNGHFGLRIITINGNPFTMFSLSFFTQFRNLERLTFGGRGNLTNIEWNFLPSSLQVLRVYSISEEIPENAFIGVPNLTYLDLSGYGITTLQPGTFRPLKNLDRLDIMETKISTLHPDQFASQGNLRILHFNFNEIEELPDGIFKPLVNLGFNETTHGLFLLGNKLRRLSVSSFGQHPQLRIVDFSRNQIFEIQRGLFSRFHPQPIRIDLSLNVCINWPFSWDSENLDEHPRLRYCFDNFDGITTTTPSSADKILGGLIVIFVNLFIKFYF